MLHVYVCLPSDHLHAKLYDHVHSSPTHETDEAPVSLLHSAQAPSGLVFVIKSIIPFYLCMVLFL